MSAPTVGVAELVDRRVDMGGRAVFRPEFLERRRSAVIPRRGSSRRGTAGRGRVNLIGPHRDGASSSTQRIKLMLKPRLAGSGASPLVAGEAAVSAAAER